MKVPKEKVPEEQTPKGETPKREAIRSKYWWFAGAAVIVAALITILPQVFKHAGPSKHQDVQPNDTTQVEIRPLSPQEKELYDQATMLWRDGVYTDALKELNKLISLRPDYVNAYIIKGRIYLDNLKQYQNAVDEFRKGLDKDSHNKYLLYDLGLAYYHLGNLDQAIHFNDLALAQDSDLIIAIYNHAIYHHEYGKKFNDHSYYNKAIDLYENVIKRDREFAASSMFNLAALYARLAKHEKVENTRERYVKRAVELLDRAIEKEGLERLKKVEGEIPVRHGEDLKAIYQNLDYKKMIEKWERSLH
jgi:tetratricopeptide (TPR) repeat protein